MYATAGGSGGTYVPTMSTAAGTAPGYPVQTDGPLIAQTGMARRVYHIASEYQIRCTSSQLNLSGEIWTLPLYSSPDSTFDNLSGSAPTPLLSLDALSQIAGAAVHGSKDEIFVSMLPTSSDPIDQVITVSTGSAYGPASNVSMSPVIQVICTGLASNAIITVTVACSYAYWPTPTGSLLVNPRIPPPGQMTSAFVDTLLAMFPTLSSWTAVEKRALYRKLLGARTSLYDDLLAAIEGHVPSDRPQISRPVHLSEVEIQAIEPDSPVEIIEKPRMLRK
jgi:hypothetical protein